ncbi:MAG: methionine--tRNA ligase [Candidatus Methanomethylophilaceae archaeon]
MSKILICVAWPYANGTIHLGHLAGSILPPDIFNRYNRLLGNEVLMVSGSDQHGTPITVTAEKENTTPGAVAEKFHAIKKKAIQDMEIEFSLFTKTHTQNHAEVVQDIFNTLLGKDYLYTKESMQYYCVKCGKFLPDRYVEGTCPSCGAENVRGDQCDRCGKTFETGDLKQAHCINCGTEPEIRPTEHYFLRLSAFQDRLLKYLGDKDWWRPNVLSFTTNWLKDGLHDRAITRDMEWGVPVPVKGWESKVIYVWFDAVIGYLSASKEYSKIVGDDDLWKRYWQDPDVRHYYFLGKDNIPFHSIIWPSILMGYGGLNLPYDIPANEYLMFKGEKFSKSRGGAIDIPSVLERYEADVIRYYLSTVMPDTHDSEFSWGDLKIKVNNELVSDLGNYYHRCLSFTWKNFGEVPVPANDEELERIIGEIEDSFKQYRAYLDSCDFKKAIKVVMDLSHFGNRFFDSVKPWALVKSDRNACGSALYSNLMIVKALAIMAWPFMPKSSETIWGFLGQEDTILSSGYESLTSPLVNGQKLSEPAPVYKKIETIDENEEKSVVSEKDRSAECKTAEPLMDLRRLDIRVGKIVSVDDHPDAEKLYLLKVDVGDAEDRQIIAGLKAYYSKSEMLNRKVLVLCNLKPAKLRGLMSEGMLLAADDEEVGGSTVLLLKPSADVPNGTKMNSGLDNTCSRIEYKDFLKVVFKVATVSEGKMNIDGKPDVGYGQVLPERIVAAVENGVALVLSDGGQCIATVDGKITDGANVR